MCADLISFETISACVMGLSYIRSHSTYKTSGLSFGACVVILWVI